MESFYAATLFSIFQDIIFDIDISWTKYTYFFRCLLVWESLGYFRITEEYSLMFYEASGCLCLTIVDLTSSTRIIRLFKVYKRMH